jgi:hypothetical protein
MILIKMNKLGIDPNKYKSSEESSSTERFSFVLINPSHDLNLQTGDIIYLLKPGTPPKALNTTTTTSAEATNNQLNASESNNAGNLSNIVFARDDVSSNNTISKSKTFGSDSLHSTDPDWTCVKNLRKNSLSQSNKFNLSHLKKVLFSTSFSSSIKSNDYIDEESASRSANESEPNLINMSILKPKDTIVTTADDVSTKVKLIDSQVETL